MAFWLSWRSHNTIFRIVLWRCVEAGQQLSSEGFVWTVDLKVPGSNQTTTFRRLSKVPNAVNGAPAQIGDQINLISHSSGAYHVYGTNAAGYLHVYFMFQEFTIHNKPNSSNHHFLMKSNQLVGHNDNVVSMWQVPGKSMVPSDLT